MKDSLARLRLTLCALVGLTATAACGGASSSGSSSDSGDYKVGVILSLTGPAAAIGSDFKAGLEVFEEIDESADGLDIEYVVCDDKSTPDGAAACARQVIQQDRVNMIYGPVISSTHAGATPVLLTGPPALTPSPYASAEPGTPVFSAAGNALDLDTTTLQHAKEQGYERVAVLATTDTTGETAVTNVEQANEQLGLDISIERMGPTDVDASAQLNRLLQSDPEYIYVATSGAATGVALKGLEQLGVDLPTVLIWSNTSNAFLEAVAPLLPSETLYPIPPSWLPTELDDSERARQITAFQEGFEERTGEPVSFVVQGGYDAFQLIAQSLKEAGGDKEDLMAYLEGLDDYQGLNWNLSYSPENHLGSTTGNYTMMKLAEGDWSLASAG